MKPISSKPTAFRLFFFSVSFLLFLTTVVLFCSFKTARMVDDFLKQLGIAKTAADQKITDGLLGSGVSLYGVKNAKNIALGNRKAVMMDLLNYTKKHVSSPAFLKQYNELRERNRQKEHVPETPEDMRANEIKWAKEAVAKSEESYKKADPQFKSLFLKSVEDMKKQLQEAENPANKRQVRYKQDYPRIVAEAKEMNEAGRKAFLARFPDNPLLYIKPQLESFLRETEGVDYDAETVMKNGKKYFVNKQYERKAHYWKMAFRAGKEVVEPAREFVQNWLAEIK